MRLKSKRGIAFLFFVGCILVLLTMPLLASQDLGGVGNELQGGVDKLSEGANKYTETAYWQEKWDYLGQEWKKILLKNSAIAALDNFFTKISIVFKILFGAPYSMSLILLGIIFLWFVVFLDAGKLINSWGIMGTGGLAYLASGLLAVVLAQIKLLEYIILILGRLAFSPANRWTRLFIMLAIFLGFVFFSYFVNLYSKFLKTRKELLQKKATELAQKSVIKFSKTFRRVSNKE